MKEVITSLVNVGNGLDSLRLFGEADIIDGILMKVGTFGSGVRIPESDRPVWEESRMLNEQRFGFLGGDESEKMVDKLEDIIDEGDYRIKLKSILKDIVNRLLDKPEQLRASRGGYDKGFAFLCNELWMSDEIKSFKDEIVGQISPYAEVIVKSYLVDLIKYANVVRDAYDIWYSDNISDVPK